MLLIVHLAACAGVAALWNHFFTPVPWRVVFLFFALSCAYEWKSVFTPSVELPGNLAYAAQPWKALGRPATSANTGIVFTQLAPWTEVARESLRAGEAPLWNRHSAAGAPLLANQQTAVFHPFTLLGLLLPLGKAFTLSALLRLFTLQFFLYAFLRNYALHRLASVAGAVAYAFSTFNVVWLLFPLGLATWGVVPGLCATDEFFRRPRLASFNFLVLALALPILGGHPESAFWVGIVLAAYGLYALFTFQAGGRRARVLGAALAAALFAVALTAVWWAPTLEVLPHTTRFELMQAHGTAASESLSREWTTTLAAPNVLGTPQAGTYRPPEPRWPTRLDDYGEIASGYAGVLTLALAICAIAGRRAPAGFFFGTALFALLTVTQAPVWYPLLRKLPVVSLTLDQRLRFLWALSIAVLGSIALDALLTGRISRRAIFTVMIGAGIATAALYVSARAWSEPHVIVVLAVTVAGAAGVFFLRPARAAAVVIALIFTDLAFATRGYNPTAKPADVYPVTGAIAALQQGQKPYRIAALGWSFLAETPGYYGLEDLKTTDPMSNPRYLKFFQGYLRVQPGDYDQVIGDVTLPFFDFLNVRFLYVPPDHPLPADPALKTIYRGADGTVLENREALPRYFFIRDFIYEPSFGNAVARSKEIQDFTQTALVDRLPNSFGTAEAGARLAGGGATAEVIEYGPNATRLSVSSDGWNLLTSSDTHWPGWRATFRGRRVDVVTVNGAFVGVFVPPGSGVLELQYRPRGYVLGLAVSAASMLLLAALSAITKAK
jgi:hypothetical protein